MHLVLALATVLIVDCQKQIGDYRVDFLVTLHENPVFTTQHYRIGTPAFSSCVIVECDGHGFHEKTKEQASNDKKRDRDLQASGFTVFRFSGSDIWKDAMKCADEIIEFLQDEISFKDIEIFKARVEVG
jgi:very-short-patch-repair endonuclease